LSDSAYSAPVRLQIVLVATGGFATLSGAVILLLHGNDPEASRLFRPVLTWGTVAVALAFLLRRSVSKPLNLFGLLWLGIAVSAYGWLRWTHG